MTTVEIAELAKNCQLAIDYCSAKLNDAQAIITYGADAPDMLGAMTANDYWAAQRQLLQGVQPFLAKHDMPVVAEAQALLEGWTFEDGKANPPRPH